MSTASSTAAADGAASESVQKTCDGCGAHGRAVRVEMSLNLGLHTWAPHACFQTLPLISNLRPSVMGIVSSGGAGILLSSYMFTVEGRNAPVVTQTLVRGRCRLNTACTRGQIHI